MRTAKAELARVLAMPWGAERNFALRRALDLDAAMMNLGNVVIAVCPNRAEARRVERLLARLIPATHYRRPDGKWVVTGERTEGAGV